MNTKDIDILASCSPELVFIIQQVASDRLPVPLVAQLAIRCAMSDPGESMFVIPDDLGLHAMSADPATSTRISAYIRMDLATSCDRVDRWLGVTHVDAGDHPAWGLPAIQRTQLAVDYPDVYLLLLWLAWRYPDTNDRLFPQIAGIATLLSWLIPGRSDVRPVNTFFSHVRENFGVMEIHRAMQACACFFHVIWHPLQMRRVMHLPDLASVENNPKILTDWKWEDFAWASMQAECQLPEDRHGFLLYRSLCQCILTWPAGKHLLMYAQRNFLRNLAGTQVSYAQLPDHSESHDLVIDPFMPNCQILDTRGQFSHVVMLWQEMIGGMLVKGSVGSSSSFTNTQDSLYTSENLDDCFIDELSLRSLIQGRIVCFDAGKCLAYLSAIRDRSIAIYQEWYDSLGIQLLVPPESYK